MSQIENLKMENERLKNEVLELKNEVSELKKDDKAIVVKVDMAGYASYFSEMK